MIELSLALGKTLEELRQMPIADYRLYQKFYEKQPFGLWRQDFNAATVALSMAGGRITDHMPFWHQEDVSEDEMGELLSGTLAV